MTSRGIASSAFAPSFGGGELACPAVALDSTEDDRVEPWREVTSGPFEVAMFPGDHFYLKTDRARLLEFLTTQLTRRRS